MAKAVKQAGGAPRGLTATLCFALLFCGCDAVLDHPLVPNERLEPVRGRAVATALARAEAAHAVVAALAARPRPSCRAPLPRGPLTISAILTWTGKRRDGSSERWTIESRWARDAGGDVQHRRVVAATLPDGRPTIRTYEARVVDGRSYVAIDERFADTSRDPRLARATADAAHADVDALLALLRLEGDTLLAAGERAGLCDADGPAPIAALDAARVELAPRGRSGWIRWADASRSLTVSFDESVRRTADDVVTPETLWPIDGDPSWSAFEALRVRGIAEGWWLPAAERDGT